MDHFNMQEWKEQTWLMEDYPELSAILIAEGTPRDNSLDRAICEVLDTFDEGKIYRMGNRTISPEEVNYIPVDPTFRERQMQKYVSDLLKSTAMELMQRDLHDINK